MKEMLGRIWDYVWTKGTRENVFGGLIVLALTTIVGSVWLWSKSGFSANAATAWMAATSTMRAVWAWLAHPVGVPRGLLWLVGVVALGVGAYSHFFVRMARSMQRLVKTLLAVNDKLLDSMVGAPGVIPPPPKKEPLSTNAENTIKVLLSVYPLTIPLGQFSETQRLSYAAVEQMFEELEQSGYVKINEGGQIRKKSVCLTKTGRDYALKRNLDLLL